MSSTHISATLRRKVQERAIGKCEYCFLSEEDAYFSHEPDHIIAEKHGGQTTLDNLAWSCFECNRFKGSDIASIDPINGDIVGLMNPRKQIWKDHMEFVGNTIRPVSACGRVTERLLKLNSPTRIEVRTLLQMLGRYP